jgi:cell division protease FtsH
MVTEYGMSADLGPQTFGEKEELIFLGREISEQRNYSDEIAAKIDREVSAIIVKAYKKAKETISENKKILEQVTIDLLKKETISEEEFLNYFPKKVQKQTEKKEAAEIPSSKK